MRPRYHIEYAAVMAVALTLRALPRWAALLAGAGLGLFGWSVRLRRRLVLANLEQALPDVAQRERVRIAARAARNFGRTVAEFVRFAGRDRNRVGHLVTIEGAEDLSAALEEGRGAILVTGHLGAWALYVTALAAAGIPTALLVGRQNNPKVDQFIHSIPGDKVTFIGRSRSSPRAILKTLKAGHCLVMVADQHGGPRGIVAPFFGRQTSTLSLPGTLVARQRLPLFLMAGHRVEGGRHQLTLKRLELPEATGDAETDRRAIAALCNQNIGDAILEHPDQYFWYHRRYRPLGDKREPPHD